MSRRKNWMTSPNRRTVLGGAAALSGTALIGSGLGPARAAEPKRGGRFRVGLGHGSTTDSLDPQTYENDFSIFTCYCNRGHLTEITTDGNVVGDLAESWEASSDAATWRFKLRGGVEFHNGKSVTAEDVAASINHHRGEDSKSAAKPLVDPITEITTDGDTVVFTLNSGNADFPFIVSDYHLAIMPAPDGVVDWQSGIGTGGYVMQEWEPGVRAFYTRNPNFYKPNAAWFDEVEVLVILDPTARTNALVTDEVDMIDRLDFKTVGLLARRPGFRIEETQGTAHYTIPMNTTVAPFDDVNVRRALKHAFDREEMVQKILRGHGYVGNDHPIGKSNRYFAADLEQTAYDPDRAKFHLKEAGLDTLKVDLSAADAAFTGAVDTAILFQEKAAAAGIEVNVIREPNDGYWSNVWMVKPWSFSYWGGRPTEDWMFSTAYAAGANWNESFWDNARFNELLVAARAELDEEKRRAQYHEMQAICRDDGGAIVPMFNNYIWAVKDSVQNSGELAANWDKDGHKAQERWWFA